MRHLLDLSREDLAAWLDAHGEKPFRAGQIRKQLFHARAIAFDEMSDLPKALRATAAEEFRIRSSREIRHVRAADGTEKLLLEFGVATARIECVLLKDGHRRTICISSQVGCGMGCVFCASGLDGVERNLTAGEIIEQMLLLARLLPEGERLSHIVVMGMGEPLANLDHVLTALDVASSPEGLGISPRRITISTVGLPAAMRRLAQRRAGYQLAVSLHAPTDELRNEIVPVNDKIGLKDVLAAADEYFDACGRRLTFEYVLLAGVNDAPKHASRLASLLAGRPALLNLIPYNPVAGLPYGSPTRQAVDRFVEVLTHSGVNVQVRRRKGDKIDAACGQLRRLRSDEPALHEIQVGEAP